MSEFEIFGLNLKLERVKVGLTQEALAHQAGIDRSYVGDLERGGRNPSLSVLLRLCASLNCRIEDLTSGIKY